METHQDLKQWSMKGFREVKGSIIDGFFQQDHGEAIDFSKLKNEHNAWF